MITSVSCRKVPDAFRHFSQHSAGWKSLVGPCSGGAPLAVRQNRKHQNKSPKQNRPGKGHRPVW
ncbi:hypothetical protein TH468_16195 [Thalassospira sp. MCCC 1A03138]|nr:hypothetical protein TH468_16195 [Thalassospira sp. MCCC 1A03138]